MKGIKFKEMTMTYAKNQPPYLSLPAHLDKKGVATTCWKVSFIDLIRIVFNRKIWLSTMTFNKPLQPLRMTARKGELIK